MSVVVHVATWDPKNGSTDWNSAANWNYLDSNDKYHGEGKAVVPNNIDSGATHDWFDVTVNGDSAAGGNCTLTLNSDVKIFDFEVNGNVSATVKLDGAARDLTLVQDYDNHTGGYILLHQQDGHQTSLILSSDNANQTTSIHALGIVANDTVGSGALTVGPLNNIILSENVEAEHNQFNLSVAGFMTASSAYLMGKDINTPSNITVAGTLNLSGMLRVGGNGAVNFTQSGFASVSRAFVHNYSCMEISGNTAVFVANNEFDVGYASKSSGIGGGQPPTIAAGTGAKLTVDNGAHLSVGNKGMTIMTGSKTTVDFRGNAQISLASLSIAGGDVNATGPLCKVDGNGTTLTIGGDLSIAMGYSYSPNDDDSTFYQACWSARLGPAYLSISALPKKAAYKVESGQVMITNHADVHVTGMTSVNSYSFSDVVQLQVLGGGTLSTTDLSVGVGVRAGYGAVLIGPSSEIVALSPESNVTLGDGTHAASIQIQAGGTLYSNYEIDKADHAVLDGAGRVYIASPHSLRTAHVHGDVIGGDFFAIDANGNVVSGSSQLTYDNGTLTSSPYYVYDSHGDIGTDSGGNPLLSAQPSGPLGTLTIDGSLDASAGFTEDVALGDTTGLSSSIFVSGSAEFGGDLRDQFIAVATGPSYSTSTYAAGTAFTILTAGTITGGFTIPVVDSYGQSHETTYVWGSAIPASIASADLPALASGLVWTLNKVHDAETNTDALVLAVADPTPQIVSVTAAGDPFDVSQYYIIKYTALPVSGALGYPNANVSPFVVQAEGRVDLQDGNGLNLPAANATVGNWSTFTNNVGFSSTPDADGYFYCTLTLGVGSTYNLRLVANTAEGPQGEEDELESYRFPRMEIQRDMRLAA